MQRIVYRLIAAFSSRPASEPQRWVRPHLEVLENRLVPSATAPRAVVAPAAPPTPVQVHTDTATGHTGDVTDQVVHGYKWRRRWWPYGTLATDGTAPEQLAPTVAHQSPATHPAIANHLAVGGSDQRLVSVSTEGHVVVQHPEGPLPTERLSAIG
jgi:hypothetical protein